MRPKVGYGCEECDGEFYGRWETNLRGALSKPKYLCKRHYMREYMRRKRHTTTCNHKGCTEPATTEERSFDRWLCLMHHNRLYHTEGSPYFMEVSECVMCRSIRLKLLNNLNC